MQSNCYEVTVWKKYNNNNNTDLQQDSVYIAN